MTSPEQANEDAIFRNKTAGSNFDTAITKTNTTTVNPEDAYAETIVVLWQVMPPILLLFGTFGNVMTVVIMRGVRASASTASLGLYFTALAVSDQCLLTTSLGFYFIHKGFAWPESFFRYNLLCIIPKFVWNASGTASPWFLVALTFQRVVSVMAPHRVGILCTVTRGRFIVAIITLCACAIHMQFLFSWSYWPENKQCQYRSEFMAYLDLFEWLDLLWASLLPFLFLVCGNSVLIWQVVKAMKLSRKMRGKVEQGGTAASENVHSMSVTLIVTSAVFLILTLPVCIFDVSLQMIPDEDLSPWVKLLDTVFKFMWVSACASNFYLYLLSGRKFRQETKRYLCCHDSSGNSDRK